MCCPVFLITCRHRFPNALSCNPFPFLRRYHFDFCEDNLQIFHQQLQNDKCCKYYHMVSLLKHLSVSKKAVIIRSKINEKQLVAIIIAELSDKSIHKSAIVYTKAQPDYWLHC